MGNGFTFVASADQTADASFQDWTQKMHNSIINTGIADVSASGAISDFGSLSTPAGNQPAGYKVYSFTDSFQATSPVYFKLEYGSGAASARVGMWYTVGVSHDGSGSVTGSNPFTSREQIATSANVLATHLWFVGGDTNYLVFSSPARNIETQLDGPGGFVFAVERAKSAAGADIAEGIMVGSVHATNIYSWYSLAPSGSSPSKETEFPTITGTINPRTLLGRQVMSPVFPHPILNNNPGLNILVTSDQNFTDFDIIPIEFYPGVTHNYIKMSIASATSPANNTIAVLMLRWT